MKKSINRQVFALILFGISILMFFIVLIKGENAWLLAHNLVLGLFGFCSILWPIFIAYLSFMIAFSENRENGKLKVLITCCIILLTCVEFYAFLVDSSPSFSEIINHIFEFYQKGLTNSSSGAIGPVIGSVFICIVGLTGFRIVNSVLLFILFMILTGISLSDLIRTMVLPFLFIKSKIKDYKKEKETLRTSKENVDQKRRQASRIDIPISNYKKSNKIDMQGTKNHECDVEFENISKVTGAYIEKIKKENRVSENENKGYECKAEGKYEYPPIDLLNKSKKIDESSIVLELQANGKMLVDTLKSFSVKTKIVDVSRGPTVTRYELQPASGVKISKITSLADDIALNLAASGVRIEAPIPGKAAVGVEIPNKVVSIVNISELLSSSVFQGAKSKLTVVLGRDISGRVVVADLVKMPHLLIAGSTGSGKSVCINSFIISLVYKASPEEVKLIMIDPKVVELGVYSGIPHLLIPVVTDPKKAKGALSWAVDEMMRRYKIFARNNVRDMSAYNLYVNKNPDLEDEYGNKLTKMHSIVIIIDELSDLMMVAPNEIEDYICRLAQMARAAGMHLVIATQRPSVDVITGIIKANIPSRIALAVSSQVDSRTILDMSGAEKLLGRGDMLFSPLGSSKPIRVQGCYVTDAEIESVINYVKTGEKMDYDNNIIEEINKNAELDKKENRDTQDDLNQDPLINEAIECVVSAGQASVSLLQRKLDIGYPRAGRLIDRLEKMGIIGPHEGSKPRQVLITREQFLEKNLKND